ncbi:hypothetical protein [Ralstonia pseudosolanacearum]|uniref:hypothetical protein n=1 Tax=Ralstonia pseudosolanacearum TaxID=1310165 RepID=UPI003CEF92D4
MKKMMKGVVMFALAAAATQVFADSAATKAEGALQPTHVKSVTYSVEVMRGGQTVRTQNVLTVVGTPQSTMVGTREGEFRCTVTGALGQRYTLGATAGNALQLTVLPANENAGAITTVLQVSDSRSTLGAATISEGCIVPTGSTESHGVFDVAAMHKGEKRMLDLGNGTTVVVKLADMDG